MDWLNGYKNKIHIYAVFKGPSSFLGSHTNWKWEDGKNTPYRQNQKKAGIATLISDKIDFKMKDILIDKEGHYIVIKGSIQAKDITVVNTYASNIGSSQYIMQLLTTLKGEIDNKTIIAGEVNTPLTEMDTSSRQKINKETQDLMH